jgi:REP element-mobilizing transposase RayT
MYYVTICTNGKERIFGSIKNDKMILNNYGRIVRHELIKTAHIRTNVVLDAYVIMPDHIHSIIKINNLYITSCRGMARHAHLSYNAYYMRKFGNPIKNSLSSIIGSFKSSVSREINKTRNTPGQNVWQRNYFEHIIRNEKELYAARIYIINNPKNYK